MKRRILLFTILIAFFGTNTNLFSQGVTTSALTGKAIDSKGYPFTRPM